MINFAAIHSITLATTHRQHPLPRLALWCQRQFCSLWLNSDEADLNPNSQKSHLAMPLCQSPHLRVSTLPRKQLTFCRANSSPGPLPAMASTPHLNIVSPHHCHTQLHQYHVAANQKLIKRPSHYTLLAFYVTIRQNESKTTTFYNQPV